MIDDAHLKAQELSRSDLLEGLRLNQEEDPAQVKLAMLEGGGRISVIKREG